MSDDPAKLSPAIPTNFGLHFRLALQRDGRRRFRHGDDLMAKIVADHLVRYLEERNYVVMQKPPGPGHSTSAGVPAIGAIVNRGEHRSCVLFSLAIDVAAAGTLSLDLAEQGAKGSRCGCVGSWKMRAYEHGDARHLQCPERRI